MKIDKPVKDKIEEVDELPDDEVIDEPKKSDRERELEIELAEKRGELNALKKNANPSNPSLSHEQTKQLVFQDINNLSDEDFKKKYNGQTKHGASMIIMDQDNRLTKAEAKQLRAEAVAVGELGSKLGSEFYNFKDKILENIEDLSESARQDPMRLKKWMEAQYLSMSKGETRVSKPDDSRRKLAKDTPFERPGLQEPVAKDKLEDQTDDIPDVIPPESDISDRVLAKHMGIVSEKERKELAKSNVIYVDTDLGFDSKTGENIRFRKDGFVKVKVA